MKCLLFLGVRHFPPIGNHALGSSKFTHWFGALFQTLKPTFLYQKRQCNGIRFIDVTGIKRMLCNVKTRNSVGFEITL